MRINMDVFGQALALFRLLRRQCVRQPPHTYVRSAYMRPARLCMSELVCAPVGGMDEDVSAPAIASRARASEHRNIPSADCYTIVCGVCLSIASRSRRGYTGEKTHRAVISSKMFGARTCHRLCVRPCANCERALICI